MGEDLKCGLQGRLRPLPQSDILWKFEEPVLELDKCLPQNLDSQEWVPTSSITMKIFLPSFSPLNYSDLCSSSCWRIVLQQLSLLNPLVPCRMSASATHWDSHLVRKETSCAREGCWYFQGYQRHFSDFFRWPLLLKTKGLAPFCWYLALYLSVGCLQLPNQFLVLDFHPLAWEQET